MFPSLTFLQLVRKSDKAVIATFGKDRWANYKSSVKTDGPPNKKKRYIGQLQIYDTINTHSETDPHTNAANGSSLADITGQIDDVSGGMGRHKRKPVNPYGTHAGNYLEEVIAFSCWMVVEAEHRLRYKLLDLIEEAGEAADG